MAITSFASENSPNETDTGAEVFTSPCWSRGEGRRAEAARVPPIIVKRCGGTIDARITYVASGVSRSKIIISRLNYS